MAFNEKWNSYKIVRVTNLDGNDRTDTRYSGNIGRVCLPNGGGEGDKFFVTYLDPRGGDRFFLGTARNIQKTKTALIITTDNTVWHFKRAGKDEDATKKTAIYFDELASSSVDEQLEAESEAANGEEE